MLAKDGVTFLVPVSRAGDNDVHNVVRHDFEPMMNIGHDIKGVVLNKAGSAIWFGPGCCVRIVLNARFFFQNRTQSCSSSVFFSVLVSCTF